MIQSRDEASTTKVESRPKDYHTLSAFLTCADAAREIEFLKQALGARERSRMDDPESKRVLHAELQIGDSVFMLGDGAPEMGCKTAKDLGGSPISFYLYVPDVDAAVARATKAGAKVKDPVKEMFWGDRVGTIECPEGFLWSLAIHTRDLTPDEIKLGFNQFKKQLAGSKK